MSTFLLDNGVRVLQWETMVPMDEIDPFDGRDGLVVEAKVQGFVKVIREEGFRLPLTGRRQKNGRTKLTCGHHRWKAAKILGLHALPIILVPDDVTDQQVADVYLTDNSLLYNLATPLIISAIRIADLNRQPGLVDGEHNSRTGGKIGLKEAQVRDARKMVKALEDGSIHPNIVNIAQPKDAIAAYRLFVKHSVPMSLQETVLADVLDNPDDGVRILSRKLSEEKKKLEQAKPAIPAPPVPPKERHAATLTDGVRSAIKAMNALAVQTQTDLNAGLTQEQVDDLTQAWQHLAQHLQFEDEDEDIHEE